MSSLSVFLSCISWFCLASSSHTCWALLWRWRSNCCSLQNTHTVLTESVRGMNPPGRYKTKCCKYWKRARSTEFLRSLLCWSSHQHCLHECDSSVHFIVVVKSGCIDQRYWIATRQYCMEFLSPSSGSWMKLGCYGHREVSFCCGKLLNFILFIGTEKLAPLD